jgi:hypothetical protein
VVRSLLERLPGLQLLHIDNYDFTGLEAINRYVILKASLY